MKRKKQKMLKAFEELEMWTGWSPRHRKSVFAGDMELKKAITDNANAFIDYTKKVEAGLKALLKKL